MNVNVAENPSKQVKRPSRFSIRAWLQVLGRVFQQMNRDNVTVVAAGVAFFGMLAAFPTISAFVSLYGFFADPVSVEYHLRELSLYIPDSTWEILAGQMRKVAETENRTLGFSFFASLIIALWSAGAGIRALMRAMNIAYREVETRNPLKFNGIALFFTLGYMLLAAVTVSVIIALPALLNFLQLGFLVSTASTLMSWLLLPLLMYIGLCVLYRLAPNRSDARHRWLNPGALTATLLWIGISAGFSVYVSNFASYNETYGTLGAAVALLIWFWLSAVVVIAGAELNAELELQTAADTTVGPDKPMGSRGAHVADNVKGSAGRPENS